MPIRVGTSHFVSQRAAIRYYKPYRYEDVKRAVERKLSEGEIHLGPPEVKQGQKLGIDEDGRYYLEEA